MSNITFADKQDAWNFRVGERVSIPDPWGDVQSRPRGSVMVVERVDHVNGVVTLRSATRWERFARVLLTPVRWVMRRWLS